MKRLTTWILGSLLAITGQALAENVYVMSSGNLTIDNAVVATLQAYGHNVTLGVEYHQFDGSQSLAGIDVVYLQANANWAVGDMPAAGQTALLNFINSGGGLVTCEWVIWLAAINRFAILRPAFPVMPTTSYNYNATATFVQVTPDPILNAGLPTSFSFDSGGETNLNTAMPGATVFYNSTVGGTRLGLVGWNYSNGRVLTFSTTNELPSQLSDSNFGRLFANAMRWAAAGAPCRLEGDINGDGVVDDADLLIVLFNFGNRCP
jgi:hypothetical protein